MLASLMRNRYWRESLVSILYVTVHGHVSCFFKILRNPQPYIQKSFQLMPIASSFASKIGSFDVLNFEFYHHAVWKCCGHLHTSHTTISNLFWNHRLLSQTESPGVSIGSCHHITQFTLCSIVCVYHKIAQMSNKLSFHQSDTDVPSLVYHSLKRPLASEITGFSPLTSCGPDGLHLSIAIDIPVCREKSTGYHNAGSHTIGVAQTCLHRSPWQYRRW